ncbi:hypothetical protein Bca52824_096444 [Brassica carinata]|uniref:Uncharacterized protein n=1 Tax=Brassica carinata TaxID=52824 RepID=A0A8X7TH81_BRACI|nr:hypothetical protein Bca52824_090627 [Brassica carinata]KAG2241574.1 hypothetical protein Bca52824_096444 [Brassica carinata]
MYMIRLITLIILLFFASLNTIVLAELTYDNESLNTNKGAVKPCTSRPARQYRISPWRGSEDSKSTQWERNAIIDAFFR